jgi:uncharacterized protein YbaR (Trm112 family)
MTIVACPACGDEVTAPERAAAETIVRCPLCGEQYPLAEALSDIPPMLQIVASGPAVATSDDGDLQLATPVEPRKPFVFEEKPGPRRPATRSGSGRSRRPERNPLVEALKIVAGGVVGLTIGQLILWWMPGNWGVNNRDPARLGRNYGQYVPWLVPASIRDMGIAGPQAAPVPEANRESMPRVASSGASSSDTRRRRDSIPSSVEPTDLLSGTDRSLPPTKLPPDLGPELTLPPDPLPITADPNRTAPAAPSSDEAVMQVSSDELKFALAQAQQAWETRDPAVSFSQQMLTSLRELGWAVTFANESDEENQGVVEAVRGLLREISADRSLLIELGVAPPAGHAARRPGHIVFGKVEGVTRRGQIYATRVQPESGSAIDVVSMTDPQNTLPLGVTALILGAYVADPTQLPGYQGAAEPVVIGGMALTFPRAEPRAEDSVPPSDNKPPAPPKNEGAADAAPPPPTADRSSPNAAADQADRLPAPPDPAP